MPRDSTAHPVLSPPGAAASEPLLPDRPFAAWELGGLGLTRPALRSAVALGAVLSPFHGVYVPASLGDTHEVRAAALALITSEHHVVCDRTAAWLHGVNVFAQAELATPPLVETCALRGHAPTRLRGTDGRTRDLAPGDVQTLLGVTVTTPLRTALDLGCHLRRREAMAALNALARLHGITPEALAAELRRLRGRRGLRQLRDLIGLVEPRIESPRESWVWLEIHDHGLQLPEPQHWIEIDGVPTYRLDFAYPLAHVCVEYDGADFHDRTPEQRAHDEERRTWLRDHGWTVIVVRLGDFTGAELERWIGELRQGLRAGYTSCRF